MSQIDSQSLEIKFKNQMVTQVTKEQQMQYFKEEYGSIAEIFMKWRDSTVDDFGRHLFPMENLEKMMKFYQKDKLQPKISMLLQILGRCSEEDIAVLMGELKKDELRIQAAGKINKVRQNQTENKATASSINKP
jgi:hypothetical protein